MLALSACSLFGPSGPYDVYFQERSAQLDVQARGLVAEAAKRANDEPGVPVEVIGYTDSAGSPPADFLLSKQRAQVVADALAADGVAASRLVRIGRAARAAASRVWRAGGSKSRSAAVDRGTRLTPRGRAGATKIGSERGRGCPRHRSPPSPRARRSRPPAAPDA